MKVLRQSWISFMGKIKATLKKYRDPLVILFGGSIYLTLLLISYYYAELYFPDGHPNVSFWRLASAILGFGSPFLMFLTCYMLGRNDPNIQGRGWLSHRCDDRCPEDYIIIVPPAL